MPQADALLAFISYSRTDGPDFVYRLRTRLRSLAPHLTPWSDFDRLPGTTFPTAISRALRGSAVLLFVMTPESVRDKNPNWCQKEALRAYRWGIPILPLQVVPRIELPFDLEGEPPLPFTEESDDEWEQLRERLLRIGSPEFVAQQRADRLHETLAAARMATGPTRERLIDLADWHRIRQEEEQKRARPAREDDDDRSDEAFRHVEQRGQPAPRSVHEGFISVNEMPIRAPVTFFDRDDQQRALTTYLKGDVVRVITVVGGDGDGKTGLLAALRRVLRGRGAEPAADAFLYLWARGYRRVTPDVVLADLCGALPDEDAGDRLRHGLAATEPWHSKLDRVVAALNNLVVHVVIDDAHVLLDKDGEFIDRDLGAFLVALVERTDHRLRLIVAAARKPVELHQRLGERAKVIPLSGGVPMPEAGWLLQSLDDGTLGLAHAGERELAWLHRITKGFPRLLELVAGVRQVDPDRGLLELITDLDEPDDVRAALLAAIMVKLDRTERLVVQALAALGRPAGPEAISYLLHDFAPHLITSALLNRLCERYVIHRDGGRYYLPVLDAEIIRGTVPPTADRPEGRDPFTLRILRLRGARYLHLQWTRPHVMEDLWPQFSEIELRIAADDWQHAFELINRVDEEPLRRWGRSATLNRWRLDLHDKLDAEAQRPNLSYLAAALDQQDNVAEAEEQLRALLGLLAETTDVDNRARTRNQLGGVLFRHGRLAAARDLYAVAMRDSTRHGLRPELAEAQMGLALHQARTGHHDEALHYLDEADEVLTSHPEPALRARLQLNRSWVLGQLGQSVSAIRLARSAGELASEADDQLLRGACLNGEATHRLYWEGSEPALRLALDAVGIGTTANNTPLLTEAYVTVALAHLFAGNEELAIEAATAATGLRRTLARLNAFAVLGLAAFAAGQVDKATSSFSQALADCDSRFHQDERDYSMLDSYGLMLSGLALTTRDRDRGRAAIDTYRHARGITRAIGAMDRNQRLLRCFVRRGDAVLLEQIRAAANAETG